MRRALIAIAALAVLGVAALVLEAARDVATLDVRSLARRAPPRTALMRERIRQAARKGRRLRIEQRWVPYERISPLLRRAVLIAEDDAFFSHGGLDWNEIREAARRNLEAGRIVRGGSTVTQQLAKNLYLGEARTPGRKLREVLLARRLERALTKRRIFELYLNLIEWGDGIYGAEAAARHWFGVPAADLDARQSCRLAAIVINPRRYSPLEPSRRIERRVRMIASRMRRRGYLSDSAYAWAIGKPPLATPFVLPWPAPPDTTAAPLETPASRSGGEHARADSSR